MTPITNILTGQIILGCWAIFLLFWFVTSFFTKKTVEGNNSIANTILIRMAIVIFIVLILGQHVPFVASHLWSYSTTSGVIADVIAIAGLLLMLWSRVVLGANWSASVVFKENHELIQRGPYALIRHPIYSGLLLMFLGESIWYGSVMWFLVLICVFIGFWMKAQKEETLLTKHFPAEYPAYRERTKALIPFVL
jgi:protein-S-isoprenylcysteine O-methyltransferase Ste14